MLISFPFFACHFWWTKRKILCEKYISNIFHVYSVARDHILILNILFFNKLRKIIPEVRSEMRDLLIFIFILKTTGTFTLVLVTPRIFLFDIGVRVTAESMFLMAAAIAYRYSHLSKGKFCGTLSLISQLIYDDIAKMFHLTAGNG